MHSDNNLQPIGIIESPYAQKFAVPRQPGLVPAARAQIILQHAFADADCVRGLEEFSHIWVLFLFHETQAQGWKPLVRPPRLGGNEKRGVFATRSTFRPNAIGMSVVELVSIQHQPGKTIIEVNGGDWVNQTPVIDLTCPMWMQFPQRAEALHQLRRKRNCVRFSRPQPNNN